MLTCRKNKCCIGGNKPRLLRHCGYLEWISQVNSVSLLLTQANSFCNFQAVRWKKMQLGVFRWLFGANPPALVHGRGLFIQNNTYRAPTRWFKLLITHHKASGEKELHCGCRMRNFEIADMSVSADCVLSIASRMLNWQLCKGPSSNMGIRFGRRGVGRMSVDKSDPLLCLFTGTGQQADEVVQSSSSPCPNGRLVRIQLNEANKYPIIKAIFKNILDQE